MEGSQYFEPSPTAPSRPATVTLALPDLTLRLATDTGVFSANAVDPGTRYLLLDGPRPDPTEQGHVLDLGCGYGAIALALGRRAPAATVWAVDVNERARRLCRTNAESAGMTNVIVTDPAEVPGDIRFSGIWSNPPIRIGKPALHELLVTWLARLQPEAGAALVVQKHLGSDSLARWLTEQGYAVERLGSRTGYRLLEVRA
ncbi:MAG: class I SAM-dependent methyltransferase [Acidimicrobiales bacterium]